MYRDIYSEGKVQKWGRSDKTSLRKWYLGRDLNKIRFLLGREEKASQAKGTATGKPYD